MKATILISCLGLSSCAIGGPVIDCCVVREQLDVDLSQTRAQSLEVVLRQGHILVTTGDILSCDLYVDLRASDRTAASDLAKGLRLSQRVDTNGLLHLALEHERIAALDSAYAFYRLTVPATMDLDIMTSQGDVTLRNYAGKVRVRTDSGRIRADMNSTGVCTLVNHSGSTELTGNYGKAEIRSDRGAILADLPQSNRAEVVRLDMASDSGPITLRSPEDENLAMTFATDRGTIQSDLPLRWASAESSGNRRSQFVGGLGERPESVEVKVDSESGTLRILRSKQRAITPEAIGSAQQPNQLLRELGDQPRTRLGSQ